MSASITQRELRFRIWDIELGRYLATRDGINYQLMSTYERCVEVETGEGRGIGLGFGPGDGFVQLGVAIRRKEQFIVEQYTGFNDSGGVPVFEGDVVRGYDGGGNCIGDRTVRFLAEEGRWAVCLAMDAAWDLNTTLAATLSVTDTIHKPKQFIPAQT